MKMAKRLFAFVLALTMMLVATACGGKVGIGKKADEKNTITFMGWGSLEEKKVFTSMIDQFQKANPGVKINYQHVPGTVDDYLVKLTSLIAANKMPDMFYIHADDFHEWVASGRLENLSPYMEKSQTAKDVKIWEKSLDIFRYNPSTKQMGTKDGDVYGLPKDLGPWAMVYNKTLFETNGVPLPDPEVPMTQSEFIELCKKLTKGEGMSKQFGTANYPLEAAVYSNGADFLDETKTKLTMNTPEFAEAMQWVGDLARVHGVAPTPEEDGAQGWFTRWCNGKVAMAWMGPWDQHTFWNGVKFEWDLMPTPVNDKTGLGISWLSSAALCISKDSKNKQLAYNLAEYFAMNKDAQVFNYQSGQAVPNIIEMAENDYKNMDKMPANKQVFLDIIEDPAKGQFKPTYYTKNTTWYDYFNAEAVKVWNGEMTAAEFLKQIQPELQKRLDEGNK